MRRKPAPLAVVGGNTSDAALDLAGYLRKATAALPEAERPLLLLTSATADLVPGQSEYASGADPNAPQPELGDLYNGRTFRFCFTNRQMAAAVTQFVWQRDDLRPDSDPVHVVRWNDDTYSRDLWHGFLSALQNLAASEAVADWVWATGGIANGGLSGLTSGGFPVRRAGLEGSGFRMVQPPTPQLIDSSVGTFLTPNRFEEQAARNLLDLAMAQPQRRPLLVVTGQANPSRRFLRALARMAPDYARRFVVVTGGAVSFNTIYRDRQVAWPVQDLPFPLVFFCHNDPVDPDAGFRFRRENADPDEVGTSTTGTDEVLLNGDIVESLAQSFCREGTFAPTRVASPICCSRSDCSTAGSASTRRVKTAGRRLFLESNYRGRGNRHTGTGEHVVCLLPRIEGGRVLPQATIEVWTRHSDRTTGPIWERHGEPLEVSYDDAPPYQGGKP